MNLRIINLQDLKSVSQIHIKAFSKSALSHLGIEAVQRYYEWLMVGPYKCFPVGAFNENNNLVGYCFGGIFGGSLSGYVSKNKNFLITKVLLRPWLIVTNSIFRNRILLGLRVSKKVPVQLITPSMEAPQPYGILSIAVDPAFQGQGVGRLLIKRSEEFARENGFSSMHLTVASDNLQAIRFYESIGWQKVETKTGWKGVMAKKF